MSDAILPPVELQCARALLELANQSTAAGCFELDLATLELRSTTGLAALLGLPTAEVSWLGLLGVLAEPSRSLVREGLERTWSEGRPFDRDIAVSRERGRQGWLHLVAKREMVEGKPRVLGAFRDVDRRRSDDVALARLAASLGPSGVEPLADAAVRAVAEAFHLDAVMLFEVQGPPQMLSLLAGFRNGQRVATRRPSPPSPACSHVLHTNRLLIAAAAAQRFPGDPLVAGHEGFAAVTLHSNGGPSGLLTVASRRPFDGVDLLIPMLEIIGGRLAAGLEQQRLRKQLLDARALIHHANRLEALATMVGSIAKELEQQTAAIFEHLDLASSSLPDHHAVQHDLARIEHAAAESERLLHQLQAFARGPDAVRADLDLTATVRELEPGLRARLPEALSLTLRTGAGSRMVRADFRDIQQILEALLDNARDANPRGEILLELSDGWLDQASAGELGALPTGPWCGIAVADQGPGVPPERAARLFEPTYTTKAGASGLGLTEVRELVERLGGHIALVPRPGWGTTFVVYLPGARPERST
jgi:signal transduction histidine kinase